MGNTPEQADDEFQSNKINMIGLVTQKGKSMHVMIKISLVLETH
jgi:hypothetical protein